MNTIDSERNNNNISTTDLVKRTSQLSSSRSARSDESVDVEFNEIIANRQSRIDTLDQLSQLAENSIKAGLELSEIKPPIESPFEIEETADEDEQNNASFETETQGNVQQPHIAPATLETMPDQEDFRQMPQPGLEHIVGPQWIGNIRCFWPNKNGRPRITIGPNWGFTIFLGCLVASSLYVSVNAEMHMYEKGASWPYLLLGAVIILSGMASFFMTLMGDPGIPPEVYKLRARPYEQRRQMPERDENGSPLCHECQVYVYYNREHCDLCDVCIDKPDHHCVFYSKCIGGGNVWYFRLSLVMFVINMTYFFLIYGFISLNAQKKPNSSDHHLLI